VRLPLLHAAVVACGVDADAAEVECVLANLVARKWVRGYLSHRPPVLVLAKVAAFKPMAEVLGGASVAAAPGVGVGVGVGGGGGGGRRGGSGIGVRVAGSTAMDES